MEFRAGVFSVIICDVISSSEWPGVLWQGFCLLGVHQTLHESDCMVISEYLASTDETAQSFSVK